MTGQQAECPGSITGEAAGADLRVREILCAGDRTLAWWEEELPPEALVAVPYENFPAEDLAVADDLVRELAVADLACTGLVALEVRAEAIRRTQAHQSPQVAVRWPGAASRPARSFGAAGPVSAVPDTIDWDHQGAP